MRDNYKLTELKHEYKELKNNWEETNIGTAFPRKHGAGNKEQYAMAIIHAREILISNDSNWSNNRKSDVQQQNTTRNSEAMESIGNRLMEMSNSYFCKLQITDTVRDAYLIGHVINEATIRHLKGAENLASFSIRR